MLVLDVFRVGGAMCFVSAHNDFKYSIKELAFKLKIA